MKDDELARSLHAVFLHICTAIYTKYSSMQQSVHGLWKCMCDSCLHAYAETWQSLALLQMAPADDQLHRVGAEPGLPHQRDHAAPGPPALPEPPAAPTGPLPPLLPCLQSADSLPQQSASTASILLSVPAVHFWIRYDALSLLDLHAGFVDGCHLTNKADSCFWGRCRYRARTRREGEHERTCIVLDLAVPEARQGKAALRAVGFHLTHELRCRHSQRERSAGRQKGSAAVADCSTGLHRAVLQMCCCIKAASRLQIAARALSVRGRAGARVGWAASLTAVAAFACAAQLMFLLPPMSLLLTTGQLRARSEVLDVEPSSPVV